MENSTKIQKGAEAYAIGFSKEFLTYRDGEGDDYKKRLQKYLPSYLAGQSPNVMTNTNVKATDLVSISSSFYTTHQLNVDVKARVEYTSQQKDPSGNMQSKITIKDVYLRVPVFQNNNNYSIEDLPVFIASPDNASPEFKPLDGNSSDSDTRNAIESMLNNFLKTYCEGNSNEINYYMSDSKNSIKGLAGDFTFKNISELKVFDSKGKNENIVVVTYLISDKDSGQEIKQRVNIITVKKEGRYYISKFDVRTGNLKGGN
jgi:hypothetical protein